MNLIGLSTTDLIEIAAPPRVSPSNLVKITPSKFNLSLNAFAVSVSYTHLDVYKRQLHTKHHLKIMDDILKK